MCKQAALRKTKRGRLSAKIRLPIAGGASSSLLSVCRRFWGSSKMKPFGQIYMEGVWGVWCHGAIINLRALALPALSFHARDLRVWISHCPQQPNLVTGWTTWKQYTELHKESSQSPLPSPHPTSLPPPEGLRGWWWVGGGGRCHVYNGEVAGSSFPGLGSLKSEYSDLFCDFSNVPKLLIVRNEANQN